MRMMELFYTHKRRKRCIRISCLVASILLCAILLSPALQAATAAVTDGDLVLFMNSSTAAEGRIEAFGDVPVRLLNNASDGRQVAVAEFEGEVNIQLPEQRNHTIELFVLEGQLFWDGTILGANDYAYLPSDVAAPKLRSDYSGAVVLLFLDPPRETDGSRSRFMKTKELAWRRGVVSQKDTGIALKLEVMDLRWVAETGQRTWLLRAGSDLKVPWEVHDGVEEGFLLQGDYRIGECLPGDNKPLTGDYTPGGYFYRPGGLIHSGPESGSQMGAVWLLRTPTRLTVDFVDGCE
jgi:hypothetical protein